MRPAAALLGAMLTACATGGAGGGAGPPPEDGVRVVLEDQVAAWNRGDLQGFMEGYWRSPDLTFTSGGTVRRGWRTTLDRYRETYGGRAETMGRLSFSDLEVHPLGTDAAWVLGRWRLAFADGDTAAGVFTLVFRRLDGAWRIVHDHTSAAG